MSDELTRSEYRSRIHTMADVIEDEAEPGDHASDMIHEQADSSSMVMYTNEAIMALKHSENGPQEWQHLVSDGDSWQDVIRTMAFDATRTDLTDELRDRDLL